MFGIFVYASCGGEEVAATMPYDNTRSGTSAQSVQGALDELYVRCATRVEEPPARVPLDDTTNALAARVQVLELKVSELQTLGVFGAERVTYNPGKTTLAGKTVQAAVDELETRVRLLEDGTIDQGEPGPELFELRDRNGNRPQPPGVGGSPQGPPQGGSGGGGPQQGGPPRK